MKQVDFIVYDANCIWGWLLSRVLSISAIQTLSTFPFHPTFHPFDLYQPGSPMLQELPLRMHRSLEALCRTYGLPRLYHHDFYFRTEALNIVFMPREFHPASDRFDQRYLFVGPSIAPRAQDHTISLDLEALNSLIIMLFLCWLCLYPWSMFKSAIIHHRSLYRFDDH
ncbi:hypothetical protein ccbrp13_32760 [Ktedonobacteria bacterium brp13]|nr:hypothetical protein ccbrp13_32760 [Ktedonobacteria bacterium brp13]